MTKVNINGIPLPRYLCLAFQSDILRHNVMLTYSSRNDQKEPRVDAPLQSQPPVTKLLKQLQSDSRATAGFIQQKSRVCNDISIITEQVIARHSRLRLRLRLTRNQNNTCSLFNIRNINNAAVRQICNGQLTVLRIMKEQRYQDWSRRFSNVIA